MKMYFLMALFAVIISAEEWPTFVEWKNIYGRVYVDSDEESLRSLIYKENLEIYADRNTLEAANGPNAARYGPDEFSDLSPKEWRDVHGIRPFVSNGPSPDGQCNFEAKTETKYTMSPEEIQSILKENGETVDWRTKGAVTGVKNQGQYGTCGYFSTIAVMEGINVMQGNNTLISLSEQENIDCCTSSEGCHGWPGEEIDWYKKNKYGASTENSYPYKGSSSSCKRSSAKQTPATASGKLCVGNGPKGEQSAILAALIKYGPAVWMMGSGPLNGYKGGVITTHRGDPGTYPDYSGIDHATTLVGAGDTSDGIAYWIVKNSWGGSFGEKGYYRVQRGGSPPELNCPGGMFGLFPGFA